MNSKTLPHTAPAVETNEVTFGEVWDAFAEARRLGEANGALMEPEALPLVDDVLVVEAVTAGTEDYAARSYTERQCEAVMAAYLASSSPEQAQMMRGLLDEARAHEHEPRITATLAEGWQLTKDLARDAEDAPTPEVATQRMTARVVRFRKTRVGALSDARSVSGDRLERARRVSLSSRVAPRWARHARRGRPRTVRVGRLVRVVCRGAPSATGDPPSSDGDPPSVVRTAHSTPKTHRLARAFARRCGSRRWPS